MFVAIANGRGLLTAGPAQAGWDYFVAVAEGLAARGLERKRCGMETPIDLLLLALLSSEPSCATRRFLRAVSPQRCCSLPDQMEPRHPSHTLLTRAVPGGPSKHYLRLTRKELVPTLDQTRGI